MPPVTYGLVQQDESDADPSNNKTVTLHVSRTADIIDRVTTRVALLLSSAKRPNSRPTLSLIAEK